MMTVRRGHRRRKNVAILAPHGKYLHYESTCKYKLGQISIANDSKEGELVQGGFEQTEGRSWKRRCLCRNWSRNASQESRVKVGGVEIERERERESKEQRAKRVAKNVSHAQSLLLAMPLKDTRRR